MILVPALRVMEPRFLAHMTLTGERFGAREAAGAGLLTAVVDDEVALDAWVADRTTASARRRPARSAPPRGCCGACPAVAGPRA